jgi:hypothetical protein
MSVIPVLIAVLAILSALKKEWAEGGRFLVAGLGAWLMGKALSLTVRYARRVRANREARALPLHIVLIAISYSGIIGIGTFDSIDRINKGASVTWRMPLGFLFYSIGVVALRMLSLHLSYERRTRGDIDNRWHRCTECGSSYASKYCCRCGTLQPGKEHQPE